MKITKIKNILAGASTIALGLVFVAPTVTKAQQNVTVSVDWNHPVAVSQTTSTTQLVESAYTIRGFSLYNQILDAAKDLHTDYTRIQYWYPFVKLAVAELDPPTSTTTSWDFTYMDTFMQDFFKVTRGHPLRVINVGTIPAWMFVTPAPVPYPQDPTVPDYNYSVGNLLTDPSGKQVADYFTRVFSWFTQGGFTDENGVFHGSYHHYKFPFWQILNEVQFEHALTAPQYVTIYDATVNAIHKIDPDVQFEGPEYENIATDAAVDFVKYFLNHANHQPGTPIDWLTFHNYVTPGTSPDDWENDMFGTEVGVAGEGADGFIASVKTVVQARDQLSPQTKISIDELGTFFGLDINSTAPYSSYPPLFWIASGAFHAYCYENIAKLGVNVVSMTQMVGYPNNSPSVAMLNWETGHPNARYWILKLLRDNFGPGDVLTNTTVNSSHVAAQSFGTSEGKKLLLINKSNATAQVTLPAGCSTTFTVVDEATSENPPRVETISNGVVTLAPFAVGIVGQPHQERHDHQGRDPENND
jgi:hypothetical protein